MIPPSRVARLRYRQLYRTASISLLGAVVALLVLLTSPVARADPHALFYTTVGQQQLFFNTLAALDQADYVETEQLRQQLVDARQAAAEANRAGETFTGITEDPVISETRTNQPAILTRPLTLEGDDAYTAQQAYNHAIEVARRTAVTDLVTRVFCQRALGREKCSELAGAVGKRSFGFVPDPLKWKANAFIHGTLGALLSGTPEDDQIREDLVKNKDNYEIGRIYDPAIASLRSKVSGDAEKEKMLEAALEQTALSFLPPPVNGNVYDGLEIDADGTVNLAVAPGGNGNLALAALEPTDAGYSAVWEKKMYELIEFPWILKVTGEAAAKNIETIAATLEEQGEVADIRKLVDGQKVCTGETCKISKGDILPTIEVPAAAKIAQVYALANVLGTLDSTIVHAVPDTIASPAGQNRLVKQTGLVEGIQTSVEAGDSTGQVAGEITFDSTDYSRAPSLGVNPVIPHRESELAHAIEALFPGFASGTNACGCGLAETTNDFGAAILAKINRFTPL
ncbi:MAG: hypothetical protein WEA04_01670 [Candidatus Andersenbacteria bacterium]